MVLLFFSYHKFMILPKIINEGYVGTKSINYHASQGHQFHISGLLDRNKQIDMILTHTDLIKQCHSPSVDSMQQQSDR